METAPVDDEEFGFSDPGTPEEMQALFTGMFGQQGDTKPPQDSPPAAPAKDEPKESAEAPTSEAAILAADGKTLIPHAVLRGERERARSLEQRNRELAEELERLRTAQAPPQQDQPPARLQEILSEDEIAALETDFPEVGKLARTMQEELKQLRQQTDAAVATVKKVDPIADQLLAQRQQEQDAEMVKLQEAIDQVPLMRYLVNTSTENRELFDRAREIEGALRALPAYRQEPWASVKVFKAVQAELEKEAGKISIPAEYQPVKDLRSTAEQAVRNAGQFVPTRLSDLEGGIPPEADPLRTSEMSEQELLALYLKVGEAEYNRLIARA